MLCVASAYVRGVVDTTRDARTGALAALVSAEIRVYVTAMKIGCLLLAACNTAPAPATRHDAMIGSIPDAPRAVDATHFDASPTEGTVRFVALGDTGKANGGQALVATAVRNLCAVEGCDFAVLLGDNIYDAGVESVTDPRWQTHFEMPYSELDIPFYAVLGNHDYGGRLGTPPLSADLPGVGNEWQKGQFQVDYTAHSSKWRMPATYYTIEQGPVGIVALDTNAILWSNTTYGDQAAWLPGALQAVSERPWKLLAGHHPLRSNGDHGNAGSYDAPELAGYEVPVHLPIQDGTAFKAFMETNACGVADMYMAGHDHGLAWINEPTALCGTELVISGAGAGLDGFRDRGNATRYETYEQLGFFYVVATVTTLRGRYYDGAGALLFDYTLSK